MSDYIKREYKLPNGGTVTADFDDLGIAKITIQAMDALFDILNSSDVVEVVRCKDCKHNYRRTTLNHGERDNPSCKYTNYVRDNDFYCGFGERADT